MTTQDEAAAAIGAVLEKVAARDPQAVGEFLRAFGMPEFDGVHGSRAAVDAERAECGADAVVTFTDDDELVLAVAVNLQLDADDDTVRWQWPSQLSWLKAHRSDDAALVVIAPDPEVAWWSACPLEVLFGNVYAPFVLGPDDLHTLPGPAGDRLRAIAAGAGPEEVADFFAHLIDDEARWLRDFLAAQGIELARAARANIAVHRAVERSHAQAPAAARRRPRA